MEEESKIYKVGDYYTSTKSKISGVILEIINVDSNTVKVKLDVDGKIRWTTWQAK